MREIFIKDDKLKEFNLSLTATEFFTKYTGCPKELRNKEIVKHTVKGIVPHKSFVDYLTIAYNTDHGIIIRPDFIWHIILNEISKIVLSDPEKVRKSFTNSKNSIDIEGNGNSMVELPVDNIMKKVFEYIPSLEESDIILELSTIDDDSRFAFASTFLEMASPFYNYYYVGCVYNKIKVLGEKADYSKMRHALSVINRKIDGLSDYYEQVSTALNKIIDNWNDDEFWKRILWTEHGYITDDVDGWIMDFSKSTDQLSKIEYTESISGKKYIMISGLLSSKVEDGYMIPNFEKIIVEEGEVEDETSVMLSDYKDLFNVSSSIDYADYVEKNEE